MESLEMSRFCPEREMMKRCVVVDSYKQSVAYDYDHSGYKCQLIRHYFGRSCFVLFILITTHVVKIAFLLQSLRALLDCLTKPCDIMHLTKFG